MSIVHHGFEDLVGRRFGDIRVERLQRRQPRAWLVMCSRCKSEYVLPPQQLSTGQCIRIACRRMTEQQARESNGASVGIGDVDPDGMRNYLDYLEKKCN